MCTSNTSSSKLESVITSCSRLFLMMGGWGDSECLEGKTDFAGDSRKSLPQSSIRVLEHWAWNCSTCESSWIYTPVTSTTPLLLKTWDGGGLSTPVTSTTPSLARNTRWRGFVHPWHLHHPLPRLKHETEGVRPPLTPPSPPPLLLLKTWDGGVFYPFFFYLFYFISNLILFGQLF